jgi:hypothetical protein
MTIISSDAASLIIWANEVSEEEFGSYSPSSSSSSKT